MLVWLNGEFLERESARVSVFDAGFQHGVGLFETMQAQHGRVFRVLDHLERLRESAESLLLTERLHVRPLSEAIHRTIERNGLDAARVRLTITGGNLANVPQTGVGPVDPTIVIVAQPPTAYPPAFFTEGVVAMIADGRTNPFDPMAGHKTLHYWPRIHALQTAAARGAGESLWFTVSNHLASGSVSNVFLAKDGALVTPYARGEEEAGAIPAPVLPGITRRTIIALAEAEGVRTERRMLAIDDLLAADEVFLTNASWGILPVTRIERESIAGGEVGPLTARLREAWLAAVDSETR
jgi:branched-subunit amino acid aminotransferase/4-amino-4-deoxychorismate lyase